MGMALADAPTPISYIAWRDSPPETMTPERKMRSEPRIIRKPTVQLIAWTNFQKPNDVEWTTDSKVPAEQLIEMAGRQCYESWANPAGRTNAEYVANMLDHGHMSVIEHGTATFRFTGVSRSFTHELVRHRLFSYSQLSQRFVSETDAAFVEPNVIADDPKAHEIFVNSVEQSRQAYAALNEILKTKFDDLQDKTLRRKKAREASRAVLPNAVETKIVVTGNFRTWRHFVRLRSAEHTDVEIRAVAIAVLQQLQKLAPSIFGDFEIYKGPDGLECARTKHIYE